MPTPSFMVYIDESGDDGFNFAAGSSEWLVISAVITKYVNDLPAVRVVDKIREDLHKPPKQVLHFQRLKHEQKVAATSDMAKADLVASSVFVYKPGLIPESFNENYRLYFFFSLYLLQRVSWYCRDNAGSSPGDGTAKVYFSNRATMPYTDLRNYMHLLRQRAESEQLDIYWPALPIDEIVPMNPGKKMGLQVADGIAHCLWKAVEKDRYGNTEDRYLRILKPVIYNRKGKYFSYGLKGFPASLETQPWAKEFQ